MTTAGTTVIVSPGATVTTSVTAAVTIDVPAPSPVTETINVQGAIDGGSQSGISLLSARSGFSSIGLNLNVAAGGSVSGSNAVLIGRNPASTFFTTAVATIDNAGTLTGSSGIALAIGTTNTGGYQSITNRATGVIGAIAAPIGTLANAGTIDGGGNSAIDTGSSTAGMPAGSWTNTGTITSASAFGTIANMAQNTPGLSNSGRVSNTSTGPAFSGTFVYLNNLSGGVVSANGNAIVADGGLSLTNAGQINGNIVVNTPQGVGFSAIIDSSLGTITGNVTLGNGSDTIVARYSGTPTLVTGISGTINAGGGLNAVQLKVSQDTTFTTAINLPATIQLLRMTPAKGVTATLDAGFVPPGTIDLTGEGSVVNRTAISGNGTLFTADVNQGPLANFTNLGTLSTSGGAALSLTQVQSVLNSGTITAANGIGVALSVGGTFTNTGTVVASDRAVVTFSTPIDNKGLIRSTGSTGVIIDGSSGLVLTNSGQIEGAVDGVASSVLVSNSGIISGVRNGVLLNAYGALSNASGGVVDGGALSVSGILFNTSVANAGTLNGDVVLEGAGTTYLALPGGVLNGDLTLGPRGVLVADLVNNGPGQFAGITGAVTAPDGTLRYRVNSDAAAVLGPAGPFQFAQYEIGTGATLALSAPAPVTQQIILAGSGNVVLDADLRATTDAAVVTTNLISVPSYVPGAASALSITNRGTITLTRPADSLGVTSAVALAYADTFTNEGTISVIDRNSRSISYAIGGSPTSSVVNLGNIWLDGGIGIFGAGSLINSGSIVQVPGGAIASGLSDVTNFDNRGTVSVAGPAVIVNPGKVLNSGTLSSANGPAIVNNPFNTPSSTDEFAINNLASGIISGGAGVAIQVQGASLTNSGTISGSVDLGFTQFERSFSDSTYVAARGSIAGGLTFGSGNDTLIVNSATTGVTGTIDGGAGDDGAILDRTGGGSVGGLINFDRLAVRSGSWIVSAPGNFANGTTVAAGASLTSDSATLAGAIANNGTLNLAQASNGIYASAISGSGNLIKTGTGTLILTGANTHTGGTGVNVGTLQIGNGNTTGSIVGNVQVANGATLTFNRSDAVSFGNVLSGSGALIKQGQGTLTLSGNSSAFTGSTTAQAGTLALDGSLGGNASVSSGARLQGAGTLGGSASIASGGILSGRSGQVLTMGGLGLVEDSVIEAALGAPSATGLFKVNGNLVLDGTVNVTDAGGYGLGVYRLIDYTGALTDNGLNVGTRPLATTSTLTVQTSQASQVNLIVGVPTGPDFIQFWDGANTAPNGRVDGGNGSWTSGAATNWTNPNGIANFAWNRGFAVFQGAAGTVTVDGAGVSAQGMQFAIDGYRVTGGSVTLVGQATVRVGDGSAAGAAMGAAVDSVLTGSGGLVKQDLGTLTLGGANTYTGGTTVSAGTLRITGSVGGNIANNASLVFDRGDTSSYTGVISGTGTLTKAGAGTLVLSGVSTYTGATMVAAGTLTVNGSIASSAVTVNAGATLAGHGPVGTTTVFGTISPSSPLVVGGNYTQGAGSSYSWQAGDILTISGTASLLGGRVQATNATSGLLLGDRTAILTAAGGRSGTYAGVDLLAPITQPFLTIGLTYDANSVYLQALRNGVTFASTGGTINQRAAASGADGLAAANGVSVALVNTADVATARLGFDALSGEIHATLKGVLLDQSRYLSDAVQGRLASSPEDGSGIWVQALGGKGDGDSDRNAAANDRWAWGWLFGIDTGVGNAVRAGLTAGYNRSHINVDARASQAKIDSFHLGGYAGGKWGGTSLSASVTYSWDDIATTRNVAFAGFADRTRANYKGQQLHLFAEAAHRIALGGAGVEPFAGIAWARIKTDAFAEVGGAAALQAREQNESAAWTTLGLRADAPIGERAVIYGSAAWRHTIDGRLPTADLAFAGGTPFTVYGNPLDKDTALLSAGVTLLLGGDARLGIGYSGSIGSGTKDHGGRASLSIRF